MILVGKSGGTKALGIPRSKFKVNVKMGHKYRLMVYTGLICYRIGFRGGLS
jgi:hypothetical protein